MVKKTALGRGLGSLISGGVSQTDTSGKKGQKKSKKKQKAKPDGSALASTVVAAKRPAAAPTKQPAASASVKKAPRKSATAPRQPAKPLSQPVIVENTSPTPAPVPNDQLLLEVPLAKIVPNPHQPRKSFDETALAELAESIRAEGLLQPVVVRKNGDQYELIAGERRWRACQLLKLKALPVRVIEASETSSAVLSLIENLQREDLNPMEEAMGYAALVKDFGLTQEQVAERVGRNRASIANMLRLLQLGSEIRGFLAKGLISTGHAKVLLGLEGADLQLMLARQVIEHGWSVRETERQVERTRNGREQLTSHRPAAPAAEQGAILDVQKRIANALGTPVNLKHSAKKGRIVIEYFGNDDLQRIIERMGIG